jgi:hypothetical protein
MVAMPGVPLTVSSPIAIRALYEKIACDFPSSYAKKNKELVDAFTSIIKRLEALHARGGFLQMYSLPANDAPGKSICGNCFRALLTK